MPPKREAMADSLAGCEFVDWKIGIGHIESKDRFSEKKWAEKYQRALA